MRSLWIIPVLILAAMAFSMLQRSLAIARRNRRFPRNRYTPQHLAAWLKITEQEVAQLSVPVYQEVHVPKRSGGTRRLEIPDLPTRALQRRILRRVLAAPRAHRCAVGFERGRSIVDAARPHTNRDVVIHLDIRNFFESTSAKRVRQWFEDVGWDSASAEFLTMMTTCNGHLPQGAPTSPRLSNLINARLDAALERVARRYGGQYTRYADDLTFSFDRITGRRIRGILQMVRRRLKFFGYHLNGRKTRICRRHQRQSVLGLTVNNHVAVPRHVRRRLRAIRHHLSTQRSATMTPAELEGWTAYEQMVRTQARE